MDSEFSHQASKNLPETFPVMTLLERGIHHIHNDRYAEGVALLSLFKAHSFSIHANLAELIDLFLSAYNNYTHAQQRLKLASSHIAEINKDINATLTFLTALKSALFTEIEKAQHTVQVSQVQLPHGSEKEKASTLYAVCLAPFEIRRNNIPLALCVNRNGQAILRYLVAHPYHSATADTLVEIFWPGDENDVVLHKLHVAISALRRALQSSDEYHENFILYKNGNYQFSPHLHISTDVDEFLQFYKMGLHHDENQAVPCFEQACALYTRPFLLEDLYLDWSFAQREKLRRIYIDMCQSLALYYLQTKEYEIAEQWALKIIKEDYCEEPAYRLLMRIHASVGKRNEAIQAYRRCQQVLLEELNLKPMPETTELYQCILDNRDLDMY